MMKYSLNNWFVIQTIVKKEKTVKNKIDKLHIENLVSLLPLRRLCIKKKSQFNWVLEPLFPGYFFINKELEAIDVKLISRLDGVIKILKNYKNPTPVPEKDMQIILSMIDEENRIPESKAFYKNDRVVIKAGPLMNMEGRIIAVDKRRKRITMRLPFFNHHKDVQFSFEIVEHLNDELKEHLN